MVYRRSIVAALLLLALAGAGAAATTSPTSAPSDDVELGKKLNRKLPVVNLNGVSLGGVLDFIREAGGVNVVVNWRELARQKVDERRMVNFSGRNIAVGDVLRKVLDSTSSMISFDAKAGAVYVTSKLDLFARAGDVRLAGDESDASARVNEALDKTVPDVRLDSVRLRAALELVGESLQVPMDVDWKALDACGVEDDEPITLRLKHPTGAEVLYWIIRPLPQKGPVVFRVRDGRVIVTKGEEHKREGAGNAAAGK